jgi:hypothetical protein
MEPDPRIVTAVRDHIRAVEAENAALREVLGVCADRLTHGPLPGNDNWFELAGPLLKKEKLPGVRPIQGPGWVCDCDMPDGEHASSCPRYRP